MKTFPQMKMDNSKKTFGKHNKDKHNEFKPQSKEMKTGIRGALFFGLLMVFSSEVAAQGWTQLEDFPSSARDDGASFTINSIAFCGTGLDPTWNYTNDFYAFDMNSDTWFAISGMPVSEARQYSNGFASSSAGYIFGGVNGNGFLNDLWTYNPIGDVWTTVSPMPSAGRTGASSFVIGDTAYILGGRTATTASISEVWAYSINADSWTQKNPLPDSLWRTSAVAYQGKGYLLFGRDNPGSFKNSFYEYDPTNDSWTALASFPGVGRAYAALTVLDDRLVSIAGQDSIGNSYNDMWEYSVVANSWSLGNNLPAAQRRGGMCFSSNTGIYYTTGIDLNNDRLKETWKYDLFLSIEQIDQEEIFVYPNPASNEFRVTNPMENGLFDYEIISIEGKLVQSGNASTDQRIDIEHLESGNYMISIKTEIREYRKMLVIY